MHSEDRNKLIAALSNILCKAIRRKMKIHRFSFTLGLFSFKNAPESFISVKFEIGDSFSKRLVYLKL